MKNKVIPLNKSEIDWQADISPAIHRRGFSADLFETAHFTSVSAYYVYIRKIPSVTGKITTELTDAPTELISNQ